MKYQEIQIRGIEAEQMVRGVLRGGYVFQGIFYFHSSVGLNKVEAKDWKGIIDLDSGNGSLAWGS